MDTFLFEDRFLAPWFPFVLKTLSHVGGSLPGCPQQRGEDRPPQKAQPEPSSQGATDRSPGVHFNWPAKPVQPLKLGCLFKK